MRKVIGLAILASLGFVSAASADTVVFSSNFDDVIVGASGSGSFNTYAPGASFGTWTVVPGVGDDGGGTVDLLANDSSYGPSAATPETGDPNAQSVDLNGTSGDNPQGAISTSFATASNGEYELQFSLSGNINGNGDPGGFVTGVTVSGNVIVPLPAIFTSYSDSWTTETVIFESTGTSTELVFSSLDPTGYSGPLVAGVIVTGPAPAASVPTPASLLSGSALLGLMFVAKSRSRKNAA